MDEAEVLSNRIAIMALVRETHFDPFFKSLFRTTLRTLEFRHNKKWLKPEISAKFLYPKSWNKIRQIVKTGLKNSHEFFAEILLKIEL